MTVKNNVVINYKVQHTTTIPILSIKITSIIINSLVATCYVVINILDNVSIRNVIL